MVTMQVLKITPQFKDRSTKMILMNMIEFLFLGKELTKKIESIIIDVIL